MGIVPLDVDIRRLMPIKFEQVLLISFETQAQSFKLRSLSQGEIIENYNYDCLISAKQGPFLRIPNPWSLMDMKLELFSCGFKIFSLIELK